MKATRPATPMTVRAGVLLLVVFASPAFPEDAATLDDLSWLAGCWTSSEGGQTIEECWLAPGGGMMVGMHRTVGADGRASFEFLRIAEVDGGLAYLASPGGRTPTPFHLTRHESRKAVFENPEHDFPQRMTYWLDGGGVLHARVEAERDGEMRGFELVLRRAPWPDSKP